MQRNDLLLSSPRAFVSINMLDLANFNQPFE